MARIDFSSALSDAFEFTFNNLPRLFRLSGLWLAIMIAIELFIAFMGDKVTTALAAFFYLFLYVAVSIMFAVAWHRVVLTRDGPQTMMDMMHFGKREWRFFGYTMLFVLIVAIPAVVAVGASRSSPIVLVGGWALVLVAAGAVSRLSLVLPATAIGESGSGLAMAWHRSKGNMLRLFFGPIVCALPFVIVSLVLHLVFSVLMQASPAFGAVQAVIMAALRFVLAGLAVSFLSFCYRQVAGEGAAMPRPMAGAAVPAE